MADSGWRTEHDGPGTGKEGRRAKWKAIFVDCQKWCKENKFTAIFLPLDTIMLAWLVWWTIR
jgi:uncharacterized protein YceK